MNTPHHLLSARCVFDGPVYRQCFRVYIEQVLRPTLKPDDIVVMDNLRSHMSVEVRLIIHAARPRSRYALIQMRMAAILAAAKKLSALRSFQVTRPHSLKEDVVPDGLVPIHVDQFSMRTCVDKGRICVA